MNKKTGLTGIGALILIAGVVVFSNPGQELRPSGSSQYPAARPLQKGDAAIPEHVFYDQVFNSILILKNAEGSQKRGGTR